MNNVKSSSEDIAKAVSETTKHVEFLAAAYPEIRIMTEQLSGRFGVFRNCYPVETYLNKTGLDILEKPENK